MTDRPVREGSAPPASPADPSRRGFLSAGGATGPAAFSGARQAVMIAGPARAAAIAAPPAPRNPRRDGSAGVAGGTEPSRT
ncbi:MAG: hypothetical protein ACKORL_12830, partial [Phycisphaerales bacterium]